MAEANYIYVRYLTILLIEDCLSITVSFIYEVAFKIICTLKDIFHLYIFWLQKREGEFQPTGIQAK